MKKTRYFALSVAASVLGVIGMSSVAGAVPTSSHSGGANAVQTGVVRIDPNNPQIAYVTGNYTCPAGFAHLFVSVKQVASGKPDFSSFKERALIETGLPYLMPVWHSKEWRVYDVTLPHARVGARREPRRCDSSVCHGLHAARAARERAG